MVSKFSRSPDSFLRNIKGIIHVGANTGQEIGLYAEYKLDVVWIEPIPDVFATLQANLAAGSGYPRQQAFQYLVTDEDDGEYTFHLANNGGASSSVFDIHLHRDIWPEIAYEHAIILPSITLATLVAKEGVDIARYDALVMDTQGSELLVLRGAESLLGHFKYIKAEAADFEAYRGGCQVKHIDAFLKPRGFRQLTKHVFAQREEGGAYYDIVYARQT